VSSGRHHTVSRFLLDRFARVTDNGRLVCQLETASGATAQISPRDATIVKHFYSVDTDDGFDSAVEDAIARIESGAAPIIDRLTEVGADGLAKHPELPLHERLLLALFISVTRQRTPIWREQTKSLFEQFVAFQSSERARRGQDAGSAPRAEDRGDAAGPMPTNVLIQLFVRSCESGGWSLCLLDWTFVRPSTVPLIVGDTPVSMFDPTPKDPGSSAGLVSSPNAETFIPLDPRLGVLVRPNPKRITSIWEASEAMEEMTGEERAVYVSGREGRIGEAIVGDPMAQEFNLRTYAHAQRHVFGNQKTVCDTHSAAKANPVRLRAVMPPPPRFHLLEDDPAVPGLMRAMEVLSAPTALGSRHRRS
jgi:hypothetical protein